MPEASSRSVSRSRRRRKSALVAGIDEAGRGPFAGPLVLACVWCSPAAARRACSGIRDSKRLSFAAREAWFLRLKCAPAVQFVATRILPETINRRGMAWALREGVRRLTERCGEVRKVYLDGGLRAPAHIRQETIIRGDEQVPLIAAASIVAKVVRDRAMLRLHRRYPAYRFDLHKGYGTALHCSLIRSEGLSPVHRKAFCRRVAPGDSSAISAGLLYSETERGAGLRNRSAHATI